jgi:hypothetical protein
MSSPLFLVSFSDYWKKQAICQTVVHYLYVTVEYSNSYTKVLNIDFKKLLIPTTP